MSFVFATSHLPTVKRPHEEEEEDQEDVQPMQRAGSVRAFSHLPEPGPRDAAVSRPSAPAHLPSWSTETPEAGHEPGTEADADSHGDFAPPATQDGNNATGRSGERSALPVGSSRLFEDRPMPPKFAPQMATTYGAAPSNRGGGSPPGSGDKPAAALPNSGIDLLEVARRKHNSQPQEPERKPAAELPNSGIDLLETARRKYNPPLQEAEEKFRTLLDEQQEKRKAADNERAPLKANADNIKSLGALRAALKATKAAQDFAKKRIPKPFRKPFDELNKRTGLDPAAQIKDVDAKISDSEARTSELKKNIVQPEAAHQQALKATQEAVKQKKELEEAQKQKLEQQRKEQLEQQQKQKLEQQRKEQLEQQKKEPKYQPYA